MDQHSGTGVMAEQRKMDGSGGRLFSSSFFFEEMGRIILLIRGTKGNALVAFSSSPHVCVCVCVCASDYILF